MVAAINSALSGLKAASKRIEVSANNIANQSSTSSIVNGQRTNKPFVPQRVDQVSLSKDAIELLARDVEPPSVEVFSPEDPVADEKGIVQQPNVDQADELVEQKLAAQAFKASVRALKVQDETTKSLLNIIV